METFGFQPNWGMQLSQKPEVKRLTFGDGYEQVAPKGLNHNLRSYSLTFSGSENHINRISDFLDRHGGYKAFLWTPYGSSRQGKFRAGEWQITYQTGFFSLSVEFREVVV